MDYFQDSYNKWSTCSVEDFQSYYDQQGSNFCLKATDATETTTTTTTTVTTSTTTSGTKITTLKPAEKKCIEAGGSRCVQNCKKFNLIFYDIFIYVNLLNCSLNWNNMSINRPRTAGSQQ